MGNEIKCVFPAEETDMSESCVLGLLIGDKAPSFHARTTTGMIQFPDDFRGKWIVLLSHPADFTPVCTTEFIFLAEMIKEFEALNTQLIGLSVDSLSSHLAWLYAIQKQVCFHGMNHVKINFPLIADLSGKIAKRYGMIHPNASQTKTVRGVFFIDPKGIIRTILYYPSSMGRHFEEIKRILMSLQLTDEIGISTPANWEPGDEVVKSNPEDIESVEKRAKMNENASGAWFLSLEDLPLSQIEKLLYKKKK